MVLRSNADNTWQVSSEVSRISSIKPSEIFVSNFSINHRSRYIEHLNISLVIWPLPVGERMSVPRPESVVVEDSVKREQRSAPAFTASAPAGGCNEKQASTIPSWTATSGCISAYLMFQYCSYVCSECRHISWHSPDAPISTEAGSNHRGESRGGQAAGWRRSAKCSVTHEGPL